MAIDVGRVLHAAIEAATQQTSTDGRAKKRNSHLSGGRAVLLGAALVTVGRLAAPKGREMLDSVQDRLEELASDLDEREHGANRNYEGEPEAQTDEDFDEEEFDDEPEAEENEDFDDEEDYEEPEADEDLVDEDDDSDEDERPRPQRRTRSRARARS